MKNFNSILILILVIGLLQSFSEHKPSLNNYNWLWGNWEFPGENTLTFESWEKVSDTLFEGCNFKVHQLDTIINEHLWLESRDGKIILSAKVFGHNEDRKIFFELGMKNKKVARFENHNHDFPTVIEYHKTGHDYLEVKLKNEDASLPPIVMQKLNKKGELK